jgi:hypothetical protein
LKDRKPGEDQKFAPSLHLISILFTMGKLFEKLILRTQKHTEEKSFLNASQFEFRSDHSTTLQCMRLAEYITTNFNNMLMAAVFFNIEKAFNTTWHSGLLHQLSESEF